MYDDVVRARVCNSPSATAIICNDREDPTPHFSNQYIIIYNIIKSLLKWGPPRPSFEQYLLHLRWM